MCLTQRKSIQLMMGSDFPSTRTTNSVQLTGLAVFYWQSNTFTHKALRVLSLHQMSPWLKQVLGFSMIPLRTKFDTETTVTSHRRREGFSSTAGLLFRSEFSDCQQNQVLAIRASSFYICRENFGQAS